MEDVIGVCPGGILYGCSDLVGGIPTDEKFMMVAHSDPRQNFDILLYSHFLETRRSAQMWGEDIQVVEFGNISPPKNKPHYRQIGRNNRY